MEAVGKGTQLKINVRAEHLGGVTLSECEFTCTFYVLSNKTIIVEKADMIKLDDNNYVALVDTDNLNPGELKMDINLRVPDGDFPSGYRTEIERGICTLIKIY